jgi:hypothetical protein
MNCAVKSIRRLVMIRADNENGITDSLNASLAPSIFAADQIDH